MEPTKPKLERRIRKGDLVVLRLRAFTTIEEVAPGGERFTRSPKSVRLDGGKDHFGIVTDCYKQSHTVFINSTRSAPIETRWSWVRWIRKREDVVGEINEYAIVTMVFHVLLPDGHIRVDARGNEQLMTKFERVIEEEEALPDVAG